MSVQHNYRYPPLPLLLWTRTAVLPTETLCLRAASYLEWDVWFNSASSLQYPWNTFRSFYGHGAFLHNNLVSLIHRRTYGSSCGLDILQIGSTALVQSETPLKHHMSDIECSRSGFISNNNMSWLSFFGRSWTSQGPRFLWPIMLIV